AHASRKLLAASQPDPQRQQRNTPQALAAALAPFRADGSLVLFAESSNSDATSRTRQRPDAITFQAAHPELDVPGSPFYNRIVDEKKVGSAAIKGSTEPMRLDLHNKGDV
ncbi:hypothetical protein ABGA94_00030, partial [Stenotrophomonas sp. 3diitr2024]